MSSEGRVRVLVESRSVPTRTIEFYRPIYSPTGLLVGSERSSAVVYEPSYDSSHERAIEEGRKLSSDLGLGLEVVDKSRWNPVRRLVSALATGSARRPTLVLPLQSAIAVTECTGGSC
jgi:hypothetical protein